MQLPHTLTLTLALTLTLTLALALALTRCRYPHRDAQGVPSAQVHYQAVPRVRRGGPYPVVRRPAQRHHLDLARLPGEHRPRAEAEAEPPRALEPWP